MNQEHFLSVLRFLKVKERGPNFWRGTNFGQCLNYLCYTVLDFNFKTFLDPNSSSFITFQCILHDPGVLFSESWNFYISGRVDLISGVNQLCKISELFSHPFCISILKVLWTQIFHHSLNFSHFCMNQEYFSQSPWIFTNWRGRT